MDPAGSGSLWKGSQCLQVTHGACLLIRQSRFESGPVALCCVLEQDIFQFLSPCRYIHLNGFQRI